MDLFYMYMRQGLAPGSSMHSFLQNKSTCGAHTQSNKMWILTSKFLPRRGYWIFPEHRREGLLGFRIAQGCPEHRRNFPSTVGLKVATSIRNSVPFMMVWRGASLSYGWCFPGRLPLAPLPRMSVSFLADTEWQGTASLPRSGPFGLYGSEFIPGYHTSQPIWSNCKPVSAAFLHLNFWRRLAIQKVLDNIWLTRSILFIRFASPFYILSRLLL